MRGEDFFDVEKHPEMTFTSTAFNVDEAGNGTVTGDLTIKGTTKPVTFDVETFGVDFQAPLNSGGMLVSEKVAIEIEGSAIKQDA